MEGVAKALSACGGQKGVPERYWFIVSYSLRVPGTVPVAEDTE